MEEKCSQNSFDNISTCKGIRKIFAHALPNLISSCFSQEQQTETRQEKSLYCSQNLAKTSEGKGNRNPFKKLKQI